MRKRVGADEWVPQGIVGLDPVADRVVRSVSNLAVMAGPGAGKTETLAQRACFLLQTGGCPSPRKILAVSYKRDSARIIRDRVRLRCPEDAWRFHSVTFDGFAKQLLDRFMGGIPPEFRPTSDYQIVFPTKPQVEQFLRGLDLPPDFGRHALVGLGGDVFLARHFASRPLLHGQTPRTAEEFASAAYVRDLLGGTASSLTFPLISRLAQAALMANPLILASLRACYSHVFLDEFQDTSGVQYDLLVTAFRDSPAVLTGVGDDKQRIMSFAGAMHDAFERLEADFATVVERPVINYRSAPELVRILRILAAAVEPNGAPMVPAAGRDPGGECAVWVFETSAAEAARMAGMIDGLVSGGLAAGEICVLTKMRPDRYAASLVEELSRLGIRSRIEGPTNDFLGEDAAVDVLTALRLAAAGRSPEEYSRLVSLLEELHCNGDEDEDGGRNVRTRIASFSRRCKVVFESAEGFAGVAEQVVLMAVELFGRERYCAYYQAYAQGSFFDDTLAKVWLYLADVREQCGSWLEAVDEALGRNVVTITTIHKSKGREYDTVIFLGLEDSAFFSFAREPDENTRTFFVAFSRAKERILFTFARERNGNRNSNVSTRPLYVLLREAGVTAHEG